MSRSSKLAFLHRHDSAEHIRVTPENLLRGLLEEVDQIQDFAISVHWKDGGLRAGWSDQMLTKVLLHAEKIHQDALDRIFEGSDEPEEDPDSSGGDDAG